MTCATPSFAGAYSYGKSKVRISIMRCLALATYVGHAKVSDTYWYLTGVPDLMAVAGRNFEGFVESRRRRPSE